MGSLEATKQLNSKRIQFVGYFYPPLQAIGSIRNFNVADQSCDYFEKVYVVSTTNKFLYPKSKLKIDERIKVNYIPTLDFQTIKILLRKVLRGSKRKESRIKKSRLLGLLHKFPLNIIIGEGGFLYILLSLIVILTRLHKIDYIYSSYSPFSDHYIAYLVKLIKPKIFWVADFRDLPKEIQFSKLNTNSKIINKADLVSTVSNGFEEKLKLLYEDTIVMRNAITKHEKFDIKDSTQANLLDHSKFNITYTGTLYSDKSDPSTLLESLKSLIENGLISAQHIRINYAGRNGETWNNYIKRFGLSELNKNFGLISLQKSIYLQNVSDLNLILTWSSEELRGVLPGKMYECLSSRNPILSIINGEYDKEYDIIFRNLSNCLVVNTNNSSTKELTKEYLLKIYSAFLNNDQSKISEDKILKFSWDLVFKNTLLKELI